LFRLVSRPQPIGFRLHRGHVRKYVYSRTGLAKDCQKDCSFPFPIHLFISILALSLHSLTSSPICSYLYFLPIALAYSPLQFHPSLRIQFGVTKIRLTSDHKIYLHAVGLQKQNRFCSLQCVISAHKQPLTGFGAPLKYTNVFVGRKFCFFQPFRLRLS
jgi:hypothetical protein